MVYKVLISGVFRSMTNDNSITIQEYIISEEHKIKNRGLSLPLVNLQFTSFELNPDILL